MYMNCMNYLFILERQELVELGYPRFVATYINYEHTEFLLIPWRAQGPYMTGGYVQQGIYSMHGGLAFGEKGVAEALGIPENSWVSWKKEYHQVIYANTLEGQRNNIKCECDCLRVYLDTAMACEPKLSRIFNTYGAVVVQ